MKKIILFALFATIITSCSKKDEIQPALPDTESVYQQQVADLIQKADKNLYDRVYSQNTDQRGTGVSVRIIPGSFVILDGDVASGTCFNTNSLCMVVVVASASGGIDMGGIGAGVHFSYSVTDSARIILNTPQFPVIRNISQLTTFSGINNSIKVLYKQ